MFPGSEIAKKFLTESLFMDTGTDQRHLSSSILKEVHFPRFSLLLWVTACLTLDLESLRFLSPLVKYTGIMYWLRSFQCRITRTYRLSISILPIGIQIQNIIIEEFTKPKVTMRFKFTMFDIVRLHEICFTFRLFGCLNILNKNLQDSEGFKEFCFIPRLTLKQRGPPPVFWKNFCLQEFIFDVELLLSI